MNLRFFFPVVLLVAAFAYYEYKKTEKDEAVKKAIQFEKLNINKIIISKKDDNIELIKQEDNWKIIKPSEYDTDLTSVEQFLELMLSLNIEKLEGATDISKYGLDTPIGYFEMHNIKGERAKIVVGSVEAIGTSSYLQKDGEIFTSTLDWKEQLDKDYFEFRSKSVVDVPRNISKIKIEGEHNFEIEKDEGKWFWSNIELTKSKVDEFLAQLDFLKVVDFIKDDISDEPGDFKTKISLHHEDEVYTLKVFDDIEEGDYATVFSSQKSFLVRVMSTYTDDLYVGPSDFRDKTAPFDFDHEEVNTILISEKGSQITIQKKDEEWISSGLLIDSKKVDEFVESVSALELDEFIDSEKDTVKTEILTGDSVEFKSDDQSVFKLNWVSKDKLRAFSSKSTEIFTLDNFELPVLLKLIITTTTTTTTTTSTTRSTTSTTLVPTNTVISPNSSDVFQAVPPTDDL